MIPFVRQTRLALQKDQTRTRILVAARSAFSRRGYHTTLMDEVAREAGLSKGAVYFHFPGKEDLFLAVVEDAGTNLTERVVEAITGAQGAVVKVRAALGAALDAFSKNRMLTRLLVIEWVGLTPSFEEKRYALLAGLAALIRGYLDEAVSDGTIRATDTDLAAHVWLGAIYEVVTRWLHTGQPARLQDAIPALTDLLLRSVGIETEEAA
ncbi:MAG: TetR/AcrR family transcriptional regulator [Armatimonadetes bacterium]|nr:TetR/AcrR family transcriptional regulator [Armatimonadota bacterium]